MSKRKPNNELRLQRLKLLDEQVLIQENECKPCGKGTSEQSACRDCEVYARLRTIGEAYEKLNLAERQERKMSQLTLEKYKDLKALGKTDSYIMKEFGMNSMQLNAWKKSHNLVKPRGEKTQEPKKVIATEAVEQRESEFVKEIEALKGEKAVMAQKYTKEIQELKAENLKLHEEVERLTTDLEKTLAGLEDCQKRFDENAEAKVATLRDQLHYALNKAKEAEDKLAAANQFKLLLMKDYVQMASEENAQ